MLSVASIARKPGAIVAAISVSYVLALLLSALVMSRVTFDAVFAEHGLVERAAIVGWLGLAFILLLPEQRTRTKGAMLWSVLCLAAAGREAEWHRAFTGDSILKPSYYSNAQFWIGERLLAGFVVFLLLIVVARALAGLRSVERSSTRTRSAQRVSIAAFSLLLATKALDRGPALIERSLALKILPDVRRCAQALEEGLESAIPLLLIGALVLARRRIGQHGASRHDNAGRF